MKTLCRFTLPFLVCLNLLWAGGRKNISLVPLDGTSVILVIGGQEKEYYLVSHGTPLKVQVDGPGKLVVMSRLKMPKNNSGIEKYTLRVMEGKNTLKTQTTQTDKSDVVVKSSGDVCGKSRKFSMNVPAGSFTYGFWLDDSPLEAALKFLFQPSKSLRKLVAVEPLSYDRIVTANINENLIAYYVATRDHPVQLRVVGPTSVKVSVRLNYDVKMKGEQKYSILVSEGEKIVMQRPLKTTKSTGLSYQEWKEVVPGKSIDVILDVPNGEHVYHLAPGETTAGSIALRFSVPQKDLMNEK